MTARKLCIAQRVIGKHGTTAIVLAIANDQKWLTRMEPVIDA